MKLMLVLNINNNRTEQMPFSSLWAACVMLNSYYKHNNIVKGGYVLDMETGAVEKIVGTII